MKSFNPDTKKAAPGMGRPTKKAQLIKRSYNQIVSHTDFLSTRQMNVGKFVRLAVTSLRGALNQLEIERSGGHE